jgi:CBS domain-containing protein
MSESSESPKKKRVAPLQSLEGQKSGPLRSKDNVKTAGERMRKHSAGKWPVIDDSKLVGIVDEENPDWQAGGHGHDPKQETVGSIMNRSLIFCYEDEDRAHAEELMRKHGLSHLPVLNRQMRVVGIFQGDTEAAPENAPEQGGEQGEELTHAKEAADAAQA